ncbi:Aste57867_16370 [Aphanomyces stellatus]|uniref:Aste57867_16370 protein n=1 Tax=Aphanomyces stellatus TaxID=120398 RepID=A0A485L8I2_9STRA|nr:hypothetical protein As57867_016313 [Aphanomyces stellatus]VFT93146.1 Aste57867_16370 [Aphanomyces stellatus]
MVAGSVSGGLHAWRGRENEENDAVHLKAAYDSIDLRGCSDPHELLEAIEGMGLKSPLSALMGQWSDLERLIQATRTPTQSIDELIMNLETIDFSSMLELPEGLDGANASDDDDETWSTDRSSVSRSYDSTEEDEAPISIAFTLEDIQRTWGDEFLADGLLHIPQRERLLAQTILLNLVRIFLPDIDSSYKEMSKTHLAQLFACANRIVAPFLPYEYTVACS